MGSATLRGGADVRSPLISAHSLPNFRALPPLALYVHIPWCAKKCPYCDFNSHEARGALPEARYVAALVADLEQAVPQVWGRRVHSVFFGGGTPSLFSAASIEALLAAVRARLALSPDAEITLEANPGTVEAGKYRDFRAAGINRISLGIQSFDSRHLKSLGRIHDGREARRAVEMALRHFDNLNLDLMYGLPGQSIEEARADVEQALALDPPHLSCYHLTIEPNTYFHRFPPRLPDDDATAVMQEALEARLAEAGYEHYETSAFATTINRRLPGVTGRSARCAHNLNYWTFGDYLGVGAGAHSKLSFPERILRQVRVRHPDGYLARAENGDAIQEQHDVRPEDVPFEFMMNALRLNAGIPMALFEERTGLPLTVILRELEDAEQRGLIERDHARVAPTARGRRFLNDLLLLFLAPKQQIPHPVTEP